MKKTVNVNLGGIPFIMDEDAYDMIGEYIDTVRQAFVKSQEDMDILIDIENRLAELFLDTCREGSIITITDAKEAIAVIGDPGVFDDNYIDHGDGNGNPEAQESNPDMSQNPNNNHPYGGYSTKAGFPGSSESKEFITSFRNKGLYRNVSDKILGGVCSGLASYLNIDPVWVRIATIILLCFFPGWTLLGYVILWIILPEANTPLQKMRMEGRPETFENIYQAVTPEFDMSTSKSKSGFRRVVDILLLILAVIAIPIVIGLTIAFVCCIICLIAFGTSWGFSTHIPHLIPLPDLIYGINGLWIVLGSIITIGIPLCLLIREGFKSVITIGALSTPWRITLLIIWLAGVICTGISTAFII